MHEQPLPPPFDTALPFFYNEGTVFHTDPGQTVHEVIDMKFLHLADLHLGKQLNDLSLLEDQDWILQQIVTTAESEQVDAVLIAGDVYQRASPQAEAMALFDRFVSQLAARNITVCAISGNHDSALRISYFSSLIRNAGVHVSEVFSGELQHVTLRDNFGEVVVWLLPFLRPAQVRRALPEEKILTIQDAVAAVIRHADIDPRKRNILVCHQFVIGSQLAGSEDLSVGGLDGVDAAVFDVFDYVAMGHIHRPQKIHRDTVRYAGSPLKYSFDEATHRKSLTLVDMQAKDDVVIRALPLYPLHDLRRVEGTLAEVLSMPYSEDYVWVTIHDELPPPDAKVSISVTFPNMLKFSVVNSRTQYDMDVLATEAMENKSVTELFSDFYRKQNNDQYPSDAHLQVLSKVLQELEESPDASH